MDPPPPPNSRGPGRGLGLNQMRNSKIEAMSHCVVLKKANLKSHGETSTLQKR